MEGRFLDMSQLSAEEFTKIQSGYNDFINKRCDKYFGYVDKDTLKTLNRLFNYVDTRSWVAGAIVGGLSVACYMYIKNKNKQQNEKPTDEIE